MPEMYPCPHCGREVFSWREVSSIGPATSARCRECGGSVSVSAAGGLLFLLVLFLPLGLAVLAGLALVPLGFNPDDLPRGVWKPLLAPVVIALVFVGYRIAMPMYKRRLKLVKRGRADRAVSGADPGRPISGSR